MKLSTFVTVLGVAVTVDGASRRSVAAKFRGTGAADFDGLKKTPHARRLMMSKGDDSSDFKEESGAEEEPVFETVETFTAVPTLMPSDVPSDIPSASPSDGVEIPVGGASETETPTLGPSESGSPSDLPSEMPSDMPSSLENGKVRKLSNTEDLDKLGLFGVDSSEYTPADSVSGSLELPAEMQAPTLAPSGSPAPSGGPSDAPSSAPSDGDGRMLEEERSATAITGTLIIPYLEVLEASAPSLTPSASPAPSGLPSLAPSSSPGPSDFPSEAPSDGSEPAYVVEIVLP